MIRYLVGPIRRVSTAEPIAALTFDDGPHGVWTPLLLDVLAERAAHATFFVLGEAVARHRPLLERMHREGHAIANHSWDHPSFPHLTRQERLRQLAACDAATAPFGCKLFRPPFQNSDLATLLDVFGAGYAAISADVVGHDWAGDPAARILERLQHGVRPGSIVLLHDALSLVEDPAYAPRRSTVEAVRAFLAQSRLRFVTLPDLLAAGTPEREPQRRPGTDEFLAGLKRSIPDG